MGHHYFRDLSGAAPDMSWVGGNLLPVVPMYNVNGTINAFFFASTDVQQGITGPHQWEPVPLVDALMCKNFCNKACTFRSALQPTHPATHPRSCCRGIQAVLPKRSLTRSPVYCPLTPSPRAIQQRHDGMVHPSHLHERPDTCEMPGRLLHRMLSVSPADFRGGTAQ